MRLLDTHTGEFVEKDPDDPHAKYAILSHTWDRGGEQTYQQVLKIQKRNASKHWTRILWTRSEPQSNRVWNDRELSPKVRNACAFARANGYRCIWIDSCCIDKTSSSELSEAINSMYAWYARADVCYAYLSDVHTDEDHSKDGSSFRTSRWFTRGWTLQELLAPSHLVFLSKDWKVLGSKIVLTDLVNSITNISHGALVRPESLTDFSVAQRLSWASGRETTRVEDRAYSLLGIFRIHMPTLYGEGNRAFRRLQEEIVRRTPDQSLFAWGDVYLHPIPYDPTTPHWRQQRHQRFVCREYESPHPTSLLAACPDNFSESGNIDAIPHYMAARRLYDPPLPALTFEFTPHGIRTQVPAISLSHCLPVGATEYPDNRPLTEWYLVILACEHRRSRKHFLGRICCVPPSPSSVECLYGGYVWVSNPNSAGQGHRADLFSLSPRAVDNWQASRSIEIKTVYIPYPDQSPAPSEDPRYRPHQKIVLKLNSRCRVALRAHGYIASLLGGDTELDHQTTRSSTPTTLNITSNEGHIANDVNVEFEHMLANNGMLLTVKARVNLPRRADSMTLSWTDCIPWASRLRSRQDITLNTMGSEKLVLYLGLDFSALEEALYFVHCEVHRIEDSSIMLSPYPSMQSQSEEDEGANDGDGITGR